MQYVTEVYKQSMKSSLRERGYIKVVFGTKNQKAQNNASIDSGDFLFYSNQENVFEKETNQTSYANFERNFTRVDGTMIFLPRDSSQYEDTGLVGKEFVSSDKPYELTINLNTTSDKFKGFSIRFGETYPVDFDIVGENGKIEIRSNNTYDFHTDEVIESTSYIKLIFYNMNNSYNRVHIHSIKFGYDLTYYNDSILESTLESYVSPICEDIPQIDFSVQLANYDKYFNADNPDSVINFLEVGQEIAVYYGYQHPDKDVIEWIDGGHYLYSEWESDDNSATIKAQDKFRTMEDEFVEGSYSKEGTTFYELAKSVLGNAGQMNYYLDPVLKTFKTVNPLPRTETKQLLQMIANACRCVLTQTRDGKIAIISSFKPDVTIECNSEAVYSDVERVLKDSNKDEYARFSREYTTVDGNMLFIPHDFDNANGYTGFVSSTISDDMCSFITNPVITMKQSVARAYNGLKIEFGNALPNKFKISTYLNDNLVDEYTIYSLDIQKSMALYYPFDIFDTMKIEFIETEYAYSPIVVNYLRFEDSVDLTIERVDMLSSPKAIKQELVKDITMTVYNYIRGTKIENLLTEEGEVSAGEIKTFYFDEPCHGFTATLTDTDDFAIEGLEIVESNDYYITVKFPDSGTRKLEIQGYKYQKEWTYERVFNVNSSGKSITWENPIISDRQQAWELGKWLVKYYKSDIEYEYDTRGNPELEAGDIIYQENEFQENLRANVYRIVLNFNQAFSSSITARKVVD